MTKEEALAIGRKLFEAFDSVFGALDSSNNGSCSSCGSCEKKDSDPGGEELLKSNDSRKSKKSCLGCAFLGTKYWKAPCISCRRNCKEFFDDACDGCCDLGLERHCHERACVKICEDKWKGSLSDEA